MPRLSNKVQHQNGPSIVIGGGLNALGVVRSLGQMGIPVVVIDTNLDAPAMRSRYGRKRQIPSLEGYELLESLNQLAKELNGPATLFLTEEKTVVTISAQRDQLPPGFRVRLPDHDRLMQLMHKQGFQDLAESYSAPVPKTVRLEGWADIPKISRLTFPCVFKPSKKSYEYGALFKKAYKVNSATEVEELYRQIEPVLSDMVVQEWIEGSDSEIYFCMQYIGQDGTVIGSFVGRKIRSWPPRIGGTASCTSAWEYAEELGATTSEFFKQVGFTGMGSMEYKRDARDNRFYMVEPTVARTDFQEEVATLNGCNLPFIAYCYENDLAQQAIRPVIPAKIWREPQTDRWSFEEGGCAIDQKSINLKSVDAYWRWNDPLPWIDYMANRVAQRLGRKA